MDDPVVTVIMPNYNGGRFIESAIGSVLAQTLANLELIVSDDASEDDSVERALKIASRDGRVRVLRSGANTGAAEARNRALAVARGRWLAVVDSDDLVHPQRLERLVAAAERDGAELAADDLLIFYENNEKKPHPCLRGAAAQAAQWIGLPEYLYGNTGRGVSLGYLKPIFSSAFLARTGIRYDPALRRSHDFDFVVRLMRAGARFRTYPQLTYFYRKYESSLSYRMAEAPFRALLAAGDAIRAQLDPNEHELIAAFAAWRRWQLRALHFEQLVRALKGRHWLRAVSLAIRNPRAAAMLHMPLAKRIKRLFAAWRTNPQSGAVRHACVLSCRSISTFGSDSDRLLVGACEALRERGFDLHLTCPSPSVLGGRLTLVLPSKLRLFCKIHIRGGWRIGRVVVAPDALTPTVMTVATLTRADHLFVARYARASEVIIIDGALLADAIPYSLRPEARTAVVIGASTLGEWQLCGSDEVGSPKLSGLAKADLVLVGEAWEATVLRRALPGGKIVVVPQLATASTDCYSSLIDLAVAPRK
jgi:glycosyltransferase involved in cell wall biosynthesis